MNKTKSKKTKIQKSKREGIDPDHFTVFNLKDGWEKVMSDTWSPAEMPWIGANDQMLEYFNLDRESVKIASETNANKDYIRDLVRSGRHRDGRIDLRFQGVDINFLNYERVELDAILAKVGDERFFQYILDVLGKLYPKRDYNRAIEIPTKELGALHEDSLTMIDTRVKEVIAPESDNIKKELSDVDGFIDVKQKLEDIKNRLSRTLAENPNYEDFVNKLSELVKSHPFFNKGEDKADKKSIGKNGKK